MGGARDGGGPHDLTVGGVESAPRHAGESGRTQANAVGVRTGNTARSNGPAHSAQCAWGAGSCGAGTGSVSSFEPAWVQTTSVIVRLAGRAIDTSGHNAPNARAARVARATARRDFMAGPL